MDGGGNTDEFPVPKEATSIGLSTLHEASHELKSFQEPSVVWLHHCLYLSKMDTGRQDALSGYSLRLQAD